MRFQHIGNQQETAAPLTIIGIGNAYRSDDAAGILIVRQLKTMGLKNAEIIEHNGEGTTLMDCWQPDGRVVIVDAVSSGAAAGTVHHIDARKQTIPSHLFSCSTHNLGLAEAVELARSLDRLPRSLEIIGIEGKSFDPGEALSAEVEQSMAAVVAELTQLAQPVA